jgi:parvulin-like peptidyl-prolyl isomerase
MMAVAVKGWISVVRISMSGTSGFGRSRRASAIGLALAFVGAAVAACGPVHAGAAATVGNDRVTTGQLTNLVQRTLADPTFAQNGGADVSSLQREELTNLVQHKLLNLAAAQEHVSVSDGEVGSQLSAIQQQEGSKEKLEADAAQNGIAPDDLRDYFYYNLLEQKLAPKITTPVVHAAHILVKDQATAEKILSQVQADPSQFASIAKSQSTDTQSGANGGDLGTVPSAEFVSEFADALDSAKVGSYFVVHSQFGWHVVHLISRTSESLQDLVTAAQQSGDSNAQQVVGQVMSRYLESIAIKVGGVSINPRYGTWDPAQAAVVASTGSLVSSAPSLAASQQAGS